MQVRVSDPTFLGYFIDKGVAAAAKVVRKVGSIFCCIDCLVESICSICHVFKSFS